MRKNVINLDCHVSTSFKFPGRLQTVVFFLKISEEISRAWRKSIMRAKLYGLTRPTASLPSLALCFQPRSKPFTWLLSRTWISKIRTVLQSSFLATWSLPKKQSVLRFLSGFLTFILWLRLLFQGSLSPSYILPSCNACCLPYPDKNTRNNQCFSTFRKHGYKAFEKKSLSESCGGSHQTKTIFRDCVQRYYTGCGWFEGDKEQIQIIQEHITNV